MILKISCTALILLSLVSVSSSANELIVVNGTAETLSRIDLETGQVDNDFIQLGLVPNQVICRDNFAYVINSTSADLYIIALENDSLIAEIDLGSGTNPWYGAFIDDSLMLVTNFVANTLSKVDTKNHVLLESCPIGLRPQGILVSENSSFITLNEFDPSDTTYGQGRLAKWDNSGDSILAQVDIGKNPQDLALDSDGELYVLCSGNYVDIPAYIYVVDSTNLTVVDSFYCASVANTPNDIAVVSGYSGFLAGGGWFGNGQVFTFDAHSNQMLHDENNPLLTSTGVISVVPATDSTIFTANFYADYITELDSAGTIYNAYPVGDGPLSMAVNVVEPEPDYICGDANSDESVDVSDAVYIINFAFAGGTPPDPIESGDANCDSSVDVSDAVYIINYSFAGGNQPCDSDGDGEADC